MCVGGGGEWVFGCSVWGCGWVSGCLSVGGWVGVYVCRWVGG